MDFMKFVAAVSAVIGLLILIGGAVALVRGSYSKARIQALREDNEDLRSRLQDHEERIKDEQAKTKILEAKVEHLASENHVLTQMITQRANVAEVIELLSDHHLQATGLLQTIISKMDGLKS